MRIPWLLDEKTVKAAPLDTYKVGVSGLSTQITLWNGRTLTASVYLRLSGASPSGRETLEERLNDPGTRFLPCKIEERVELIHLAFMSYLRVTGPLPEVEVKEQLGAIRQSARVTLQSGYTLGGDFLYMRPSGRCRLSDLLNFSNERFLLFLTHGGTTYINREAIVKVVP